MRTTTALAAVLLALATGAAGCSSSDDSTASATSKATTFIDGTAVVKAASLPPQPDAATRKAYLDALNAIDPRIAKPGKDEQTVSQGRNQCASIKSYPHDEDKLSQLALDRFTIATRLPDIATAETGAKVTQAAHKHLCPDS